MRASASHVLVVAAFVALALNGCGGPPRRHEPVPLTLETVDGHALAATLWPVETPSPPGVVLVHMLGADRDACRVLANHLQRSGMAVLAFDLRGHGASRSPTEAPQSHRAFSNADWAAAVHDVDAAIRALIDHGADPQRLATAGAGIGANLALSHAANDGRIAALALLSPGHAYRGVAVRPALDAYMPRPLLLMASEGDAYSAQTCRDLARDADAALVEMRFFPGSAHGTDLLDLHVEASQRIAEWLRLILNTQP